MSLHSLACQLVNLHGQLVGLQGQKKPLMLGGCAGLLFCVLYDVRASAASKAHGWQELGVR